MKIISKLSEPDFESQYLSSEWYKPFYDPIRDKYSKIVQNPDLNNWNQNYIRKELLWKWRNPLLNQLPFDIDWNLINLNKDEFEDLLVIKESGWNNTFGPGKNLIDVANLIKASALDKGGVNFQLIEDIKNKIGSFDFKEKLILISSSINPPYTIIDGNHRAVAFILHNIEHNDDTIIPNEFILGVSSNMTQAYWLNYK